MREREKAFTGRVALNFDLRVDQLRHRVKNSDKRIFALEQTVRGCSN